MADCAASSLHSLIREAAETAVLERMALLIAAIGKVDAQVCPGIQRTDPFGFTIVEDKDLERCLTSASPGPRVSPQTRSCHSSPVFFRVEREA